MCRKELKFGLQVATALFKGGKNDKEEIFDGSIGNSAGIRNDGCRSCRKSPLSAIF